MNIMGQPVMQWQIIAKDPDKLAEFYQHLFDWSLRTDNALGYRMVDTGSDRGIKGGIWPSPPEGHSMVALFVEVDNVAEYVDKSVKLGANVVISPQKLPDGDEMAYISDPEGIPVGLFKPAKPN
jgi:predicted enzyme related to lactoylglutathione lyase